MNKSDKKLFKAQHGFTLIELLVVISIIGLLASVVLVSLNSARIKARDAKRRADLKQLSTAINLYYGDNNTLPPAGSTPGWCTTVSSAGGGSPTWGEQFQSALAAKYMAKVPLDPIYANQSGDYFYSNDDNAQGKFSLCAILENPLPTDSKSTNRDLTACSGWTNAYNYCISQ